MDDRLATLGLRLMSLNEKFYTNKLLQSGGTVGAKEYLSGLEDIFKEVYLLGKSDATSG